MLTSRLSSVPGCCALGIYEGFIEEADLKKNFPTMTLCYVKKSDLPKLEWTKGILPDPVELDGVYVHSFEQNLLSKLQFKEDFEKHTKLQKRDGRQDREFKTGDTLKFLNGGYQQYTGAKVTKVQNGYVYFNYQITRETYISAEGQPSFVRTA